MKIFRRLHASALHWVYVVALGAWFFILSGNAHAPQRRPDATPVMHVVRVDESAPESRPARLPRELPKTSVVIAPVPAAAKPAAPKPMPDPRAVEAKLRDDLTRGGFPNLGVSVGHDGAVYLAGTLYDPSEPDQINALLRRVPGVTDVHFTAIHLSKPSGRAYFGTQTGSAKNGVAVIRVFHGSPAEAAGIKKGDVIVGFDNHPVKDADTFHAMVLSRAGGERVAVLVAEGNRRETREVRLGQAAEMAAK